MKFIQTSLLAPGFGWDAAVSLVNSCQLAYKAEDAVRFTWGEEPGIDVLQVFSSGPTQGYVVEGAGFVLCAFRGTDTLGDWFTNIGTAKLQRPYGTVHRGFFVAYARVERLVRGYAGRAKERGKVFWLTGHSLGGALAQIAAQEIANSYGRAGLCTFGQPRTVNADANRRLTGSLEFSYHRVVNSEDLVTRVPPNFGHTGRLIHFDPMGRPRNALGAAIESEGTSEPLPMGEAEFERRKAQIRTLRAGIMAAEIAELSAGPDGAMALEDPDRVLDATIEGFMPGVKDHRMTEYVRLVSRLVASETRKFEPPIEMMLNLSTSVLAPVGRMDPERFRDLEMAAAPPPPMVQRDPAFEAPDATGFGIQPPAGRVGPPLMPLVIRTAGPGWEPPAGARVQSRIADFVTLLADVAALAAIRGDAGVVSFEISRDAGITELDRSLPFVKCDQVQRPPIDETGDAALVGIVDSGVDILHEAFLDGNGKTRILAIWNQRDQRGPAPNLVDPALPQSYGTLLLGPEIQAMIDAFEAAGTAPHWLWRDGGSGHGTHVAGIAAGRATSRWGPGMAPGAGLLVVVPNYMTAAADTQSLGYAMSHLDALAFLKAVAGGATSILPAPRPIAVNVSSGMTAGAHDGSTALEAAIDALSGGGRDAGFVIVKSAGNEGHQGGHASVSLFQGITEIEWESQEVARDIDYFEGWYDDADDLGFTLRTPSGAPSTHVDLQNREISEVIDGNLCQMKLTRRHHDNGESLLVISISPATVPIRRGNWILEIRGNAIRTADSTFHLWVERMENRAVRLQNDDDRTTISIPGTARHVVTVGACDTGPSPRLIAATSLGLTRDGRAKPDLAAPGDGIVSALANTADRAAVGPRTGTSMAAPHVTGALALALSRRARSGRQQFNTLQLANALVATATRLRPGHHPGFGHGILDVLALLGDLDAEP